MANKMKIDFMQLLSRNRKEVALQCFEEGARGKSRGFLANQLRKLKWLIK